MNDEQNTNNTPENIDDDDSAKNDGYAFRWSWTPNGDCEESVSSPPPPVSKKKKHGKGFVFAIITSCVFAVAFIILAVAIISDISLSPFDGNAMNGQVNINVSSSGNIPTPDGRASAEALEKFNNSVVVISTRTSTGGGTGTGIIMTENGYIATNSHVIEDATSISVKLYNGNSYSAVVIGESKVDDLAVIKINAPKLSPATFGQSKNCSLGETVYAIGTPAGPEFGWSLSAGTISCVDRAVKIYDESTGIYERTMNVIQTDVSVNPGNSGGPLINSRCEVIGIVTMKLSNGYEGMGFAIPSDGALEILVSIIETGNADNVDSSVSQGRPLIGIVGVGVTEGYWYEDMGESIAAVDEAYALENPDSTFYAPATGIIVKEITPGLDAENKLAVNDIITEANGVSVASIYDLIDLLSGFKAGDEINLKVYRDGSYFNTNITLG